MTWMTLRYVDNVSVSKDIFIVASVHILATSVFSSVEVEITHQCECELEWFLVFKRSVIDWQPAPFWSVPLISSQLCESSAHL